MIARMQLLSRHTSRRTCCRERGRAPKRHFPANQRSNFQPPLSAISSASASSRMAGATCAYISLEMLIFASNGALSGVQRTLGKRRSREFHDHCWIRFRSCRKWICAVGILPALPARFDSNACSGRRFEIPGKWIRALRSTVHRHHGGHVRWVACPGEHRSARRG